MQTGGSFLNNNTNNTTNPPKQESGPSPSLEFLIKQRIVKYFQTDKGGVGDKGWEGQKKFNLATLNCNIESLVSRNQKAIKSLASARDELEGFVNEKINALSEGIIPKNGLSKQNQINSKGQVTQACPDLSIEDLQTLELIKKYAYSVLVFFPKGLL